MILYVNITDARKGVLARLRDKSLIRIEIVYSDGYVKAGVIVVAGMEALRALCRRKTHYLLPR